MKLSIFQVDAFANTLFAGNPAAVIPLYSWLDDHLLQNIAEENNLSETAFFIIGDTQVELRWFTPNGEVDLCGHATLATAHVLYTELAYGEDEMVFNTKGGDLIVKKNSDGYKMNFPADIAKEVTLPESLAMDFSSGYESCHAGVDYLVELNSEKAVTTFLPDFSRLKKLDRRGLIITAPSKNYDVVSRCFYPKYNVNEDPVTGSAHCMIAPYWAKKLKKTRLLAHQASKRGGLIWCEHIDDRVILQGSAVTYMKGEINLVFDEYNGC